MSTHGMPVTFTVEDKGAFKVVVITFQTSRFTIAAGKAGPRNRLAQQRAAAFADLIRQGPGAAELRMRAYPQPGDNKNFFMPTGSGLIQWVHPRSGKDAGSTILLWLPYDAPTTEVIWSGYTLKLAWVAVGRFLALKGGGGEVDWRPQETMPEDYSAFAPSSSLHWWR